MISENGSSAREMVAVQSEGKIKWSGKQIYFISKRQRQWIFCGTTNEKASNPNKELSWNLMNIRNLALQRSLHSFHLAV